MIRILAFLAALVALAPTQAHAQASVILYCYNGATPNVTVPCPTTNGGGLAFTSYDSGAVSATATPANSSHAAGTSNGGLFAVPVVRVNGGSGIITNFNYKSTNGSTGQMVVRIWQINPANTTCTDNVAFASSDTDDANLITPPFAITPAAPANTTGDAATYANVQVVTWDYANQSSNKNIYACLINGATNTADNNHLIRVQLSGPQN